MCSSCGRVCVRALLLTTLQQEFSSLKSPGACCKCSQTRARQRRKTRARRGVSAIDACPTNTDESGGCRFYGKWLLWFRNDEPRMLLLGDAGACDAACAATAGPLTVRKGFPCAARIAFAICVDEFALVSLWAFLQCGHRKRGLHAHGSQTWSGTATQNEGGNQPSL